MDGFDFDFQYHWMTVTLYPGVDELKHWVFLIKENVERTFRGCCMEPTGHGSNGYTDLEMWQGIRLAYGGAQNGDTFSLSISGEHIGSLNLGQLRDFLGYFREIGLNLKFTRLDLAFDCCPEQLGIEEVAYAVQQEYFTCRATREKISIYEQVFGDEKTIVFGSRASTRYMRIYNRRGFVRFELEVKKEAAEIIGEQLMDPNVLSGVKLSITWAVGILKDFIEFDAEFWRIFDQFERCGLKVSCFEAQSMSRSKQNIEKRLCTVLTALVNIEGVDWLNDVLFAGSMKSHEKGKLWGYDVPWTSPVLMVEKQALNMD